jgi:flagellar protein FliS
MKALSEYGSVSAHAKLSDANGYKIIQLLLERGLEKLKEAKMHVTHHNLAKKCESVDFFISIMQALQASLNKELGGPLVENLEMLYAYLMQKAVEFNFKNDATIIDEMYPILSQIKEGWDGIEEEANALL